MLQITKEQFENLKINDSNIKEEFLWEGKKCITKLLDRDNKVTAERISTKAGSFYFKRTIYDDSFVEFILNSVE
jgi:hypothetical protein